MAFDPIKIKKLKPLKDHVIVTEMEFTERILNSGIILPSDNGKSSGVRPRWGKVYAIGPNQKDIKVGQWILVDHGRWTRGIKIEDKNGDIHTIRRVDNNDILLVSNERPSDDTVRDGLSSPNN
jgi:co-chaperonin GroES (HSP10)